MVDILIIGAGPAGCAAAVTARMRNKTVMLLYAGDGMLASVKQVDNYPGLPHADGKVLLSSFRAQALDMGAEMKEGLVTKILPMDDSFSVLVGNDIVEAKGIILCMGVSRVAMLENEERLLGSGVSYCATCDGMFYKNKNISVIGSNAHSVEEANFLSEIGHVTYYSEKKHDLSSLNETITVSDEKPLGIEGSMKAEAVLTSAGTHPTDGVFILRPVVALTQLLPELETKNGAIVTDKDMKTSVARVYAAGDVAGAPLQIAKAVGDGNRAAIALSQALA